MISRGACAGDVEASVALPGEALHRVISWPSSWPRNEEEDMWREGFCLFGAWTFGRLQPGFYMDRPVRPSCSVKDPFWRNPVLR